MSPVTHKHLILRKMLSCVANDTDFISAFKWSRIADKFRREKLTTVLKDMQVETAKTRLKRFKYLHVLGSHSLGAQSNVEMFGAISRINSDIYNISADVLHISARCCSHGKSLVRLFVYYLHKISR